MSAIYPTVLAHPCNGHRLTETVIEITAIDRNIVAIEADIRAVPSGVRLASLDGRLTRHGVRQLRDICNAILTEEW